MGHFCRFPLANHSDLPGSHSVFGVSQAPPMCVHTHLLAKMDSTKADYGESIPWHNSPLTSKEPFLCTCDWGGLLTSGMRGMWSGQGPAASLDGHAALVLEFLSKRHESPIALQWGSGYIYLLPQSTSTSYHHGEEKLWKCLLRCGSFSFLSVSVQRVIRCK